MSLRLCDTQPLWLTPTFQHHCINALCLCHTSHWFENSSPQLTPTRQLSADPGALEPSLPIMSSAPPLPHRAINLWHLSDTEQESLSPFVPPRSLRLSCVLNFLLCKSSQTNMRPASGAGEDVSSSYYSSNVWSLNLSNLFQTPTPPTLSFYLLLHPLFLSFLSSCLALKVITVRCCCVLGAGPEVKQFYFKLQQGSSCLLSPERNYAVWLIFCPHSLAVLAVLPPLANIKFKLFNVIFWLFVQEE